MKQVVLILTLLVFGRAISQKPYLKIGLNDIIGFSSGNEFELFGESFNANADFHYASDYVITRQLRYPQLSVALGNRFDNGSKAEIGFATDQAAAAFNIHSKSYFAPFNTYGTTYMNSYSSVSYRRLYVNYFHPVGKHGTFLQFGMHCGFYGNQPLTGSSSFGVNVDSNLVYEFKTTDQRLANTKFYLSLGFSQELRWKGKNIADIRCYFNAPLGRASTFGRYTNAHDFNDASAPGYSFVSFTRGGGLYFEISKELYWEFWKK